MYKHILEFSTEVKSALKNSKPIVALESTIISHGMPYPQNIKTALELEGIVRENGAVPATICLMNGKIKVGLNRYELELLGKAQNVAKVSRRDIPIILNNKGLGATTVAATMIAANLAGIKVFATGGIGGVHRFADKTFDISADLIEFSKTPVIVVAAGVKAILDIPKTLEFLETHGVPVLSYRTDIFPAFYSAESLNKVDRIDNADEIAKIFLKGQVLGYNSGMIIANPIPKEHEIPFKEMALHIDNAIKEANDKNIQGQAVTPFLLSKLVEITKGKSLETNIKLVENNVRLASLIAVELQNQLDEDIIV